MDPTRGKVKGCLWSRGSALILTVVLTSLLAIVGVLFLMAARIDKMATSATTDNRQLGFAVDSVVSQISEALATDLPGFSRSEEYYDYPDANNAWLADLEPYGVWSTTEPNQYDCYWRQISNIMGGSTRTVRALPVGERESIDPNRSGANADADGDGVGDARWFQVPGLGSSKGKSIYAAVRIVDNGGMMNINTGFKFDPANPDKLDADGHSQLQVNVVSLAPQKGDGELLLARTFGPTNAADLASYEREVIWQFEYGDQDAQWGKKYRPFDLSDELELRYRYQLNHDQIVTRAEGWGRFDSNTPLVEYNGDQMKDWCIQATGVRLAPKDKSADANLFTFDSKYDYRHIATAYNLDQIRMRWPVSTGEGGDPNKMVNVNNAGEYAITQVVVEALAGVNLVDVADRAQIVANILDYIDEDDRVTVVYGTSSTSPYYGFEQPCIHLSELVYRFVRDQNTGEIHRSYAVELCKRYFEDRDPARNEWRIFIDNPGTNNDVTQVIHWSGTRQFHVFLSEDAQAAIQGDCLEFKDLDKPADPAEVPGYDPATYANPSVEPLDSAGFNRGATIELQRKVTVGVQDKWTPVDREKIPDSFMNNAEDGEVHRLQRDIRPEKCIFRLWGPPDSNAVKKTLGNGNGNFNYTGQDQDKLKLQAHPANAPLVNIGELGKIFAWNAYNVADPNGPGPQPSAETMLIDLAQPAYQNLLNYLGVIDPLKGNSNLREDEKRVKGRININTAPPFVLAQLPWMRYRDLGYQRARAIVDYRNRNKGNPFKSTAGLLGVREMTDPNRDNINNLFAGDVEPSGNTKVKGPDLTTDTVVDDLEERDLIFTRISDLVTVRSDVFTAYILVRIGLDGPQKRVVAILDRSLTSSPRDAVRVLSLESVPDPR